MDALETSIALSELAVQQSVARAAWAAVSISLAGVGFTGVFGFYAYKFSKRQIGIAEEQAKFARRQMAILEEQGAISRAQVQLQEKQFEFEKHYKVRDELLDSILKAPAVPKLIINLAVEYQMRNLSSLTILTTFRTAVGARSDMTGNMKAEILQAVSDLVKAAQP